MSDIGIQIQACTEILRRYGAKRVVLFGSALRAPGFVGDIDLACEGIQPSRFFLATNEVQSTGDRSVDLVDLGSVDDVMKTEILSRGRMLYQSPDDAAEQVDIAASHGRQIIQLMQSLPSASLGHHAAAALALYLIQLDAVVEGVLKRIFAALYYSTTQRSRRTRSLSRRPLRSLTRQIQSLPPEAADWVERLRIFRNQYVHRREGRSPQCEPHEIAAAAPRAFEQLVRATHYHLQQQGAQPLNHAHES
jgi:predicted nucleotidyltransferase